MTDNTDLKKLLEDVLQLQSSTKNEAQYEVLPLQLEFLKKLQTHTNQDDYSAMEQLCIAHCVKYNHYSEMHKDTLNTLIKKYSKKV